MIFIPAQALASDPHIAITQPYIQLERDCPGEHDIRNVHRLTVLVYTTDGKPVIPDDFVHVHNCECGESWVYTSADLRAAVDD